MSAAQDAQTALAVQAAQAAAASAKSSAAAASATVVNLNAIAANALYWQGPYNANIYYALYGVVTYSGIVYVSVAQGNKGHTPDSSPDQWVALGSSGGGSGITELTGPVTAGPGTGSQGTTITDHAVAYVKLPLATAKRLLGNPDVSEGDVVEIQIGANLTLGDDGVLTAADPGLATVAVTGPMTGNGTGGSPIETPAFSGSGFGHEAGLVPDPGASGGTTRFLREDATWAPPLPTIANDTLLGNSSGSTGQPTAQTVTAPLQLVTGTLGLHFDETSLVLGAGNILQRAALTGPVTADEGGNATALAFIPAATPMVGDLLATAVAAPATPASGEAAVYVDIASKNIAVKNDDGVVNHGVQTAAAVSHKFVTAVADDGTVTQDQPGYSDLSGEPSVAVASPMTGDGSTGSPITTPLASESGPGLMAAEDKIRIDFNVLPAGPGTIADANYEIDPAQDFFSSYLLAAATLTADRTVLIGLAGTPTEGQLLQVLRQDTSAFTLALTNGSGTMYTFPQPPGDVFLAATFRHDGTDWAFVAWYYVAA